MATVLSVGMSAQSVDTTSIYKDRKDSLNATVFVGHQENSISRGKTLRTELISASGLQKMACCNLAESFENSASVTVGYSDAVTGARQIRLLGLSGTYTHPHDVEAQQVLLAEHHDQPHLRRHCPHHGQGRQHRQEGAVRAGSPVRLHVHVRKQEIKFLNMQERFDRILKGLLPDGEAVLLAVSGGVDSKCTVSFSHLTLTAYRIVK